MLGVSGHDSLHGSNYRYLSDVTIVRHVHLRYVPILMSTSHPRLIVYSPIVILHSVVPMAVYGSMHYRDSEVVNVVDSHRQEHSQREKRKGRRERKGRDDQKVKGERR